MTGEVDEHVDTGVMNSGGKRCVIKIVGAMPALRSGTQALGYIVLGQGIRKDMNLDGIAIVSRQRAKQKPADRMPAEVGGNIPHPDAPPPGRRVRMSRQWIGMTLTPLPVRIDQTFVIDIRIELSQIKRSAADFRQIDAGERIEARLGQIDAEALGSPRRGVIWKAQRPQQVGTPGKACMIVREPLQPALGKVQCSKTARRKVQPPCGVTRRHAQASRRSTPRAP